LLTRAKEPEKEALERLNLEQGWSTVIPIAGRRDGILSIQCLGTQLFVQTRSGLIAALDAETGRTQWKVRLGASYRAHTRLAANDRQVFVVTENDCYALKRSTGEQLWQLHLPAGPAAAPTAEGKRIYFVLDTGKLAAYDLPVLAGDKKESKTKNVEGGKEKENREAPEIKSLPGPEGPANGRSSGLSSVNRYSSKGDAGQAPAAGPQPVLDWTLTLDARVEQPAVAEGVTLLLAGGDGVIVGVSTVASKELYHFPTDGRLLLPPAQYGDTAYVASQDLNVYALTISTGRLKWRFTTGAEVLEKPEVTDDAIYVATERKGLHCLSRVAGEPLWHNENASRFLAANPKYVYATDRQGRLLVLDRQRGTQLGVVDTRDFVVPVANDQTDRAFLAANNGLIVCLHDRDYKKPVVMKKGEEPPTTPPNGKPLKDKEEGQEKPSEGTEEGTQQD
jgi:outer membrane protein assembly factor BamB